MPVLGAADAIWRNGAAVDAVYRNGEKLWPTFTPASITGLRIWLEADHAVGLNDGDPLAVALPDWSGGGHDATWPGSPPIYHTNRLNGHPALTLASGGAGRCLRATWTDDTTYVPWTTYAIGRLNGGANGRIIGSIYPDRQNWLLGWWNGYENVMYAEGFVKDSSGGDVAPTTNWHRYCAHSDAATNTKFYNGDTLIADNANGLASMHGGLAIGGYDTAGANELSDGEFVIVLCYDGRHTDIQRAQIGAWLTAKYGI